jgi:mannose-6-phosphate isomerase-like protein (cupin superfamily)
MNETWIFLGVRFDILTGPHAPVAVAEGLLPQGASPPLHAHTDLDDSFYVLDGRMVVRCGDDVAIATAGSWVQFPSGVPHTFRVIDRPARILLVHADNSFIHAITTIGRPASGDDTPTTTSGPTIDEFNQAPAAHRITNLGPPMEQDEAEHWARALAQPTPRTSAPR